MGLLKTYMKKMLCDPCQFRVGPNIPPYTSLIYSDLLNVISVANVIKQTLVEATQGEGARPPCRLWRIHSSL